MSVSRSAIDPIVQHIRDALWPENAGGGVATVMVGAGFSRNAIPLDANFKFLPLWNDLARAMRERLQLNESRSHDPLRLAQLFESAFGRAEFDRFLERQIPDGKFRPGDLHHRLLQLPWADVLTTNYDTLLERASDEVYERRYQKILTPHDIPLRVAPRLVKLHGTLGSGGRLIATQEDYRSYPREYAPFVNLVRQSVMESVYVLIGFTGDDPNFLEWTGWVRDELGDLAPKIYLCGVLDSSPAEVALLQQRGVTQLDLSPLFPDRPDRHALAMDWLLAALKNGEPGQLIEWAPLVAPRLESREPPLPPSKVFTVVDLRPNPDWRTASLDEFRSLAKGWRTQRLEYPGWHVAPDNVRERIEQFIDWWRPSVFGRAGDFPPVERLLVVFELCWRLELILSPISTNETDRLVVWLEEVNPFGTALELPKASRPSSVEIIQSQEAWRALALCVLRTAREDLDLSRYELWRSRLLKVADGDRSLLGELWYEHALLRLNQIDLQGFGEVLESWRKEARQPLERLRLAALYAEANDRNTATELAVSVLSATRSGEKTAATMALDAWCSILLSMLDWRDDAKRLGWSQRLKAAKDVAYDPWETIRVFREKLKSPRPPWTPQIEKVADFDAHSVTRRRRFGNGGADTMPAWQLLRLVEKAPCPLRAVEVGLVAEAAANAAVWVAHGAPSWSFSALLRATAKPEIWNEIFGREVVAVMDQPQVDRLYSQMLKLVREELTQTSRPTNPARLPMGGQLLEAGLEVLSRITLRLSATELEKLFSRVAVWLGDRTTSDRMGLVTTLKRLAARIVEALPDTSLGRIVVQLVDLRIPNETGFETNIPDHWPEPFNWLHNRKVAPITALPPSWPQSIARLLALLKSDDSFVKGRAFTRLYLLHREGWLSVEQTKLFAENVWSNVEPNNGVPLIRGYYPYVTLRIPGAEEHDASNKVRRLLLGWVPPIWEDQAGKPASSDVAESTSSWLNQVENVFRHPSLAIRSSDHLGLGLEEAQTLLAKILEQAPIWFRVLRSEAWQTINMMRHESPEDFAEQFCETLGNAVLPWLPEAHTLTSKVEELIGQLYKANFPVGGITVGLLHLRPGLSDYLAHLLEVDILRDDEARVRAATYAAQQWHIASLSGLVSPLPVSVSDSIVSRIATRKPAGLVNTLIVAARMAKRGAFTDGQEAKLIISLELLAAETAPDTLRNRYFEREVGRADVAALLSIRHGAVRLASAMAARFKATGTPLPAVLSTWQQIVQHDSLPEVHRAWNESP